MTVSVLKDWIGGGGADVLWVDFEAYARRVFANAPADWYANPTRYAATLIQAQGVIATQVLAIDVLAPLRATRAAGAAAAAPGALADYLVGDGGRFITEALDALLHRFAGKLDIVLKLDAPGNLLGPDASFDDLDDTATSMATFLRKLADRPLTGIVLEKPAPPLSSDELDACEPLMSAARHYDWVTAMSFPELGDGSQPAVALDLDVILLPGAPFAAIDALAERPRLGGGLDDAFWSGAARVTGVPGRLLHGCIPDSSKPETVLAALATLRS